MHSFERGEQVVYAHEKGKQEFGFVTSERGGLVFCRFFNNVGGLRTQAGSEGTPRELLERHESRPQSVIEEWLEVIDGE